jgi:hypothetical protein
MVSPDFTMYFSPGNGTRPAAGVLPSGEAPPTVAGGVTAGAPGTGIVGNGVVAEPAGGGTVAFVDAVVDAPFAVVAVVTLLLVDDVPMPHDASRTAAKTPVVAIVAERATEIGISLAYGAERAELCHFAFHHNPYPVSAK